METETNEARKIQSSITLWLVHSYDKDGNYSGSKEYNSLSLAQHSVKFCAMFNDHRHQVIEVCRFEFPVVAHLAPHSFEELEKKHGAWIQHLSRHEVEAIINYRISAYPTFCKDEWPRKEAPTGFIRNELLLHFEEKEQAEKRALAAANAGQSLVARGVGVAAE